MPTYRTNGAWGSGIGVNLTPAQVDNNFYELRSDLDDVIANPPTADSVVSVTQSGFNLTFHTTLGNDLGPLTMPIVQFRWRGEWAPLTLYDAADMFKVTGEGIFTVLADHTSAATFDPLAVGGSPATALYNQIIGVFDPTTSNLDDLADVDAPTPSLGQVLTWAGSPAAWRAEDPAAVALDDLTDVIAPSPVAGQVLRYLGGSPDAGWQPDTLTLDDLGDVAVVTPADGDVLTYQAGSPTGWIAASPAAVPSTLDSLTDVIAPGPSDGDVLQFDGADWVNAAGSAISDLTTASPILTSSYLELSEPSGSPAIYTSKKATLANILAVGNITLGSTAVALGATVTTIAGLTLSGGTVSGTTTLPGSGQIDSSGRLGVLGAPDGGTTSLTVYSASTAQGVRSINTAALSASSGGGYYGLVQGIPSAADQRLLQFGGAAYRTGTTYTFAAAISVFSGAAWSSTSCPAYITFETVPAGSATRAERFRMFSDGDVRIGTGSALATTATDGFLLIATCAGAPTGVPTNAGAGQIPMIYDKTNNKLYAYNGGWKASGAFA